HREEQHREEQHREEHHGPGRDTSGKHYLCGLCAAFTNIVVTFPIQKVLFRQQLYGLRTWDAVLTPFERVQTLLQDYRHHDKFTNTFQAFKVLKAYGLREYYRGLVPILLRNGPSNVLFFGLRGPVKQCLPEATSYSSHLVNDFICGGLLGAVLGMLFFPLNVVKTRMQAQIGGEFQSFSKVLAKIWLERDRKVVHLFRGAHLNYHRSVLDFGTAFSDVLGSSLRKAQRTDPEGD
uniref:S2551 protein n=1 Tax=Zosterops lateralis melanops TaxID=1220523 RepID=A0A8D2PQM0_ZOSLA